MSILTGDKITAIFCIADDFCKEFEKNASGFLLETDASHSRRNRKCSMSESEIITILICFHMGHFRNFKHYYLNHVATALSSDFPDLLSYSRFIQIEHAEMGKSTMGWFYGFKLHLVCNDRGELLNFCLTKGNVDDRDSEVFNVLSRKLFGDLFAVLWNEGIHLVTGIRSNMKNQLMGMREKILLRKRSVIETINDELKNICQIEHSRHRGRANFLMNLVSGIAAYCLFDKKPSIKYEMEDTYGQLTLFG